MAAAGSGRVHSPSATELPDRERIAKSSGQAQTAQRFYRPELDAIRFLAFSLVFIHHLLGVESPLSKAVREISALGMCLFFFLSSYLITNFFSGRSKPPDASTYKPSMCAGHCESGRFILLSLRWESSSARFNLPWRFRAASS